MEENPPSAAGLPVSSQKPHPGMVIHPPATMASDLAAAAQQKAETQPVPTAPLEDTSASAAMTTTAFVPPSQPPVPSYGSPSQGGSLEADLDHPLPVASVFSTYGMEYLIMFISLGVAATALVGLLDSMVDISMKNSGSLISSLLNPYAEAALIVSFPIFAYLFLRLESKEETIPSLLTDASRRRGMQIALVVSFAAVLSGVIGYLSSLLGSGASVGQAASSLLSSSDIGSGTSSGLGSFLHALFSVIVAGSIFGYYWYKLHKKPGLDLE